MRADARFGGHLVQGHVDAVGEVVARDELPGTVFLTVRRARGGRALPGPEGVGDGRRGQPDGRRRRRPTTGAGTLPARADPAHARGRPPSGPTAVGDQVNLEADVVAKYVEHLLAVRPARSPYVPRRPSPAPPASPHRGAA